MNVSADQTTMQTPRGRSGMGTAMLLLTVATALSGCSEDVNPVVGTDLAYSMYGLFTPELDTQWVRVFPIEGTLQLRDAAPLDAIVMSTDLITGEERVWRDSLIEQSNGGYEHAFWSPFTAAYGHTYRLEVRRSDGAVSSGETTVPELLNAEEQPFEERPDIVLPYLLRGAAENVMKAQVAYHVVYDYAPGPPSNISTDTIILPYEGSLAQTAEGWMFPINLSRDYARMEEILVGQMRWKSSVGLVILGMEVEMLVASDEWMPPGGVFDPEVLGIPNVMSNVENGFGLIVGGYRMKFGLFPPDAAAKEAGFRLFSELGE